MSMWTGLSGQKRKHPGAAGQADRQVDVWTDQWVDEDGVLPRFVVVLSSLRIDQLLFNAESCHQTTRGKGPPRADWRRQIIQLPVHSGVIAAKSSHGLRITSATSANASQPLKCDCR